jgi:hypothetical protein
MDSIQFSEDKQTVAVLSFTKQASHTLLLAAFRSWYLQMQDVYSDCTALSRKPLL